MIANLQMYAWPDMSAANDRYWGLVRDRLRQAGVPAPDALSFFEDESSPWLRDDLLLGQTCGYPYRHGLHGRVLGPWPKKMTGTNKLGTVPYNKLDRVLLSVQCGLDPVG